MFCVELGFQLFDMEIYNFFLQKWLRNLEMLIFVGVCICGFMRLEFEKIFIWDVFEFVVELERKFRLRVKYILKCREEQQVCYDVGEFFSFDFVMKVICEGEWICSFFLVVIVDWWVEIIGFVEWKMIINVFNCGVKMFMVSFC